MQVKKLDNFSNYQIMEDGRIYNTKTKRYVVHTYSTVKGYHFETVGLVDDNGKIHRFNVDSLVRRTMNSDLPELEGVEHKPMLDYEDIYEVYSNGKVWSKKYCKWMYLQDNGNGYLMFIASKDGIKVPKLVHRVVVETFRRRMYEDEEANHIDKDRSNNQLDNLQIMTNQQHHKWHSGTNSGNYGKKKTDSDINKRNATRRKHKMLDPFYGTKKKRLQGI